MEFLLVSVCVVTQPKPWCSCWSQCVVTQPKPWYSCWCQCVVTQLKPWCSCWCQCVVTQPKPWYSCWCQCVVTQPKLHWDSEVHTQTQGWAWRVTTLCNSLHVSVKSQLCFYTHYNVLDQVNDEETDPNILCPISRRSVSTTWRRRTRSWKSSSLCWTTRSRSWRSRSSPARTTSRTWRNRSRRWVAAEQASWMSRTSYVGGQALWEKWMNEWKFTYGAWKLPHRIMRIQSAMLTQMFSRAEIVNKFMQQFSQGTSPPETPRWRLEPTQL